jgi:hypothetical protein
MMGVRTLTSILACCLTLRSSVADRFGMKNCYCVSPTEVGYLITYNYTTSLSEEVHTWNRNGTQARNDDMCPLFSGKQCATNDDSDCWAIPQVQCYPAITDAAMPRTFAGKCVAVASMGERICADSRRVKIGPQLYLMPHRRNSGKHVTGCNEECSSMWPAKR